MKPSIPVVLHGSESPHEAIVLAPGVPQTLFVQDGAGEVCRITATLDATSTSAAVSAERAARLAG